MNFFLLTLLVTASLPSVGFAKDEEKIPSQSERMDAVVKSYNGGYGPPLAEKLNEFNRGGYGPAVPVNKEKAKTTEKTNNGGYAAAIPSESERMDALVKSYNGGYGPPLAEKLNEFNRGYNGGYGPAIPVDMKKIKEDYLKDAAENLKKGNYTRVREIMNYLLDDNNGCGQGTVVNDSRIQKLNIDMNNMKTFSGEPKKTTGK